MLPQLAAVHPLGLHPFSPFWSDWPPLSLLQRSFSPLWSHLLKQPKNLQYIYVTESNVALRLTTFQSSLNINNFNNGLSNLEITYIWNQPVLAFWLESSSFSAPFSSVFSSDSVFVSSVFSSVFVWNFTLLTIKHYTHNHTDTYKLSIPIDAVCSFQKMLKKYAYALFVFHC